MYYITIFDTLLYYFYGIALHNITFLIAATPSIQNTGVNIRNAGENRIVLERAEIQAI